MQITRCTKCMGELKDGVRVCPRCGFEQDSIAQPGIALKRNTILHGRYLIGNVIGQGGFGITYVGWDLTLEMKVAVKEYFPSGAASRTNSISNQIQWESINQGSEERSEGLERFLKEARRMARLDEVPSIVRVRDAFGENGTAYIVMDFVEGVTLKTYLLGHGVLRYEECMKLLSPILDSLAVIHDNGFIHRDISPDNIMLRPDGSARLLDMGAAVDVTANEGHASMAVVKRNFSAPEQYMESESLGSWTDVYAMGATIYYCMTGKVVPEALEREFKKTPLYFDPALNIPAHVIGALSGALELHAEKRIRDMREFKERLMEEEGTLPPKPQEAVRPEAGETSQAETKGAPGPVPGDMPEPESRHMPGAGSQPEFQEILPTVPFMENGDEMKTVPYTGDVGQKEKTEAPNSHHWPETEETKPSRNLERKMKRKGKICGVFRRPKEKGGRKKRIYYGIAAGIVLLCALHIVTTVRKYGLTMEEKGVAIHEYPYEGEQYVKVPDRILGLPVLEIDWGIGGSVARAALEEIVLPEKLQTIGYMAFYGCKDLEKIELPEGLTTIEGLAFHDTGLTEIAIPSTVDTIECGADLLEIPQVNIAEGNPYYIQKDGMICKTDGELTAFPSSREGSFAIPSEFYAIGDFAFYHTSLSEVTIPGTVRVIKWQAFAEGVNLQKVVMEDGVEELESHSFSGCEALSEVTIPASVKRIGDWAFYRTSLREVTIPGSVEVVESLAFSNIAGLQKVVIEEGVKELEYSSFSDCEALSEVIIPRSVKKIGERAFEGCKSLKTVTVSRDCEIHQTAFWTNFLDSDVKINYYD